MPPLRTDVLLGLGTLTLAVLLLGWAALRSAHQRMYLAMGILGLYGYAGYGAAIESVTAEYVRAYAIFLVVMVAAFILTIRLSAAPARRLHQAIAPGISKAAESPALVRIVIPLYLAMFIVPFVFPTMQLDRLISPGLPDLRTVVAARFSDEPVDLTSRLALYVQVMLYPFYLFALYRYRRRYVPLGALIVLPAYMSYCASSYLGRGTMMALVVQFMAFVWLDSARARRHLVVAALALMPLLSLFFYHYTYARLGWQAKAVTWNTALGSLAGGEMSFPRLSTKVIEGDRRADVSGYAVWLLTLPLPKILTGPISGSRINYEIAEVVLGQRRGTFGWFVVLTGLVTESIYIYGSWLFWLHALLIGCLFALLCRLTEGQRAFLMLSVAVAVFFGYHLNRGGVAAAIPRVVNGYLLFYVWIAVLWLRRARVHPSGIGGVRPRARRSRARRSRAALA